MKRRLPLLLSFCFLAGLLFSQSQKPGVHDFTPNGDAVRTGGNCYRLTDDYRWSGGSLWYKTPIDLNAPFEMEVDLMMGCKDADGADGVVFVFHPEPRYTGFKGEGMGFGGLVPSLGIEIDTWQNFHLQDPSADHVALMRDGDLQHDYSLAGPVRISNVEDCRKHRLKVSWTPATYQLRISLDGRQLIAYKGDIVKKIFRNNPRVYWGVTAATGQYNNRHEICFEKLDFVPALENLKFDRVTSRRLLDGDIVVLENLRFDSGQSEPLSDSYPELEKLYRFLRENEDMSVNIFGHTDSAGDGNSNKKLSERRSGAVAEYLIRKGIDPDRVHSKGFGEEFPIASNSSRDGRRRNRRVEGCVFRHIP